MATHSESFAYNNWTITTDAHTYYVEANSSGLASKTSSKFLLNHIVGSISARVTGGFGWVSAYEDEDAHEDSNSLRCILTVDLYLEKSNGQVVKVATATGSAERDGYLNEYSKATSDSFTYTPTAADRANYKYMYLVYTCTTSSSHVEANRYDGSTFWNQGKANPSGAAAFTVRDNINVVFKDLAGTSTTMADLTYDSVDIRALSYNGSSIF